MEGTKDLEEGQMEVRWGKEEDERERWRESFRHYPPPPPPLVRTPNTCLFHGTPLTLGRGEGEEWSKEGEGEG